MDSTHHRWMKFWPQDFESDPALKMCSISGAGFVDPHDLPPARRRPVWPYDHRRAPCPPEMLAKLTGVSIKDVPALLKELRDNAVLVRPRTG